MKKTNFFGLLITLAVFAVVFIGCDQAMVANDPDVTEIARNNSNNIDISGNIEPFPPSIQSIGDQSLSVAN